MARTEQMLKDMNGRLFGGDGQSGVLPKLYENVREVEKRTGALESWKKSSRAWVAGAAAVLTLQGTALAFYFQHVAGHIKTLAGH